MQHHFTFTASRFAGAASRARGEEVAAWLRTSLSETTEEAEIGDPAPENDGWTFWYDFGGDRYSVHTEPAGADWRVSLEHSAPVFVRHQDANARRQARFDALVVALRTIIVREQTASLKAEGGD